MPEAKKEGKAPYSGDICSGASPTLYRELCGDVEDRWVKGPNEILRREIFFLLRWFWQSFSLKQSKPPMAKLGFFIWYHLLLPTDLLLYKKRIRSLWPESLDWFSACLKLCFSNGSFKFATGPCCCQRSHGKTVFPNYIIGSKNRHVFPSVTMILCRLQWPGNKSQDPVERQTSQQRGSKDKGNRERIEKGSEKNPKKLYTTQSCLKIVSEASL